MIKFALRRLLSALPTLALVSVLVFALVQLSPGDPAVVAAGPEASAEQIAEVREQLGLNAPVLEQYFSWAGGALTGDLGNSILSGYGVMSSISERLPVTLSLALLSIIVALLIAIPMGTIAAVKSGSWVDRAVILLTSAGIAIPSFAVGLLLIYLFALTLSWLPATGFTPLEESPWQWFRGLLLPSIALGLAVAAELARHIRASLRDVLQSDYVRTARAKGLGTWKVLGKHGLKHAAIPVVTVLGLQISHLLGGAIVVEQVFGLPGVGSLAVRAVFTRDYPVIQGVALLAAVAVILINILVDLSYSYFNPRIRAK